MVVPNYPQLQEKETQAVTYKKFISVAIDASEKLPPYDCELFDLLM